jgi:hypothetical protein
VLNDKLLDLNQQIEKATAAMQDKLVASDEVVVADFMRRYELTLALFGTGSEQKLEASLKGLLNCTRGYLETSSHYDQKFLDEMCATERLIEELLKDK